MAEPPTTSEQDILMQMALDAFLESSWPRIRWLQWTLDQRDDTEIDVTEQVDALPHELGGIRLESHDGNSTEVLGLTVSGCARCRGSEPLLRTFMALLRICIDRYALEERAVLLHTDLEVLPDQLMARRAYRLLQEEYLFLGSGGGSEDSWRYEVSPRIRYFRTVTGLHDYIERRRWYLAEPRPRRLGRRVGTGFPTVPSSVPAEAFSFMRSERLRALAQRDHAELRRAETTKARTVLAGAVVEALLLDRLSAPHGASEPRLLGLPLGALYAVARERGVVSDRVGLIVPVVRDFRNLGHPGAELRDGPLTDDEADIAVSLMRLLIAEFSGAASS